MTQGQAPQDHGRQGRAAGALYGLAVGDALGMPTESLPRPEIVARYGPLLEEFQPGAPDQPLAPGLPAGTVTDDTEQALLLAQLIIEGDGAVDEAEFARRLVGWEKDMRARGSLSLLGPSTKRALSALLAGIPIAATGRSGTTNGAAMRITPVGVATAAGDLDALVARVVTASRITHNTGVALAGGAAVAAAVSAGVAGAGVPEAIQAAVTAAGLAAGCGHWVAAADVAARITWATGLTAGRPAGEVLHTVYTLVGTSLATQESVPAAFALLAAAPADPWLACRMAASAGGDTDSIAAITGAIGGACHGAAAFPEQARATVSAVNGLHLDEVAARLLAVRGPRSASERAAST
jgi:ADP-ribosylglycohydrolase